MTSVSLTGAALHRPAAGITVAACARLHLGFFDPNGSLGRGFGSVGLMVDAPRTVLTLTRAGGHETGAASAEGDFARATACLERLRTATGRREALSLRLASALPAHAGLGSGTQLALAVGRAFSEWHGLALTAADLACLLGRGRRSGIGVAGFEQGGLIVDGGPSRAGQPAPVLARFEFPLAWRVVLVLDPRFSGLHGEAERAALAALPPFPQAAAAHLCHLMLMRVMPAVAEADFEPFAAGITDLQQRIGEHFAPAQGGAPFVSAAVGCVLDWLHAQAGAAVGQSSWGPTGFAVLPSAAAAAEAVALARAAGVVAPNLQLMTVAGRNAGAQVLRATALDGGVPAAATTAAAAE